MQLPGPPRFSSIRGRLILLVLALWLPAVGGFVLQTWDTYERQEAAVRNTMRQQADALGRSIDAELVRRQLLGQVLAASPSLRERNLPAFERDARAAVAGTALEVFLVDRARQYFYTALPGSAPVARRPSSLFVESGAGVAFTPRGPATGAPAVAVLVAEAGVGPAQYNVGIPFLPSSVQKVMESQAYPAGALVAVLDGHQRVMGRSRDPERWIGIEAAHPQLREMAARGASGFVRTTTLDGVSSLTYLSPPTQHGWAALVALPEAALKGTAQRLALQAAAASALLLGLGLAIAAWAARRISRPVQSLEETAAELLAQRVPEPLHTGVAEIDRVGSVLHQAGVRARESGQQLELRVNEAVEEARQAQTRLFDARKHEAIGRLTGGVAHDFNNLLQTISMGLELVRRSQPPGPHSKALEAALSACGKAANLVRQMLAFGRSQQLRPQPVDLANLLLRSGELTGKAVGERIQLAADLDPGLPPVMADPTQLELALLNLVFNARDAMAQGGRITVRARLATLEEPPFAGVGMVRIDVEDEGHGMDAETVSRVFEPYFTTKPVGSGSGLGLPQVQAFARQSGGDVRIDSTPGRGTCVTMFLPVSRASVAAPDAEVRSARTVRPLHVLMVEDDLLVASVVPAALEQEGHRVTLCGTADEAQHLLAGGIAVDVLFTDIVMPGTMTGLELVAWCREHRPDVPALVATGYSSRTPEGIWKLLRKPYAIADLVDALSAASAVEA